jgi:branched-chain amino acid aminotransferase
VAHIQVGKGVAGPITRKLQEEFFAITSGTKTDRHNWLTPVNAPVSAATR